MTEPILTREEVEALAHRVCMKYDHAEYIDMRRYTFGLLTLEQLARAIEAAVLEKVCGEPIYQIAFSDEDGWCDTHKKCYDEHPGHMRRIVYALTRSKP